MSSHDPVNHPQHYTSHPSGIECIEVVEHMGFNLGNAIKYLWRADEKGNALEDLKKAAWYIQREIQRREKATTPEPPPQVAGACLKCGWAHYEGVCPPGYLHLDRRLVDTKEPQP